MGLEQSKSLNVPMKLRLLVMGYSQNTDVLMGNVAGKMLESQGASVEGATV